jgi:hypothetical protein
MMMKRYVIIWSFTTLAVSATHMMASVADDLLIETAFTIAQWTWSRR